MLNRIGKKLSRKNKKKEQQGSFPDNPFNSLYPDTILHIFSFLEIIDLMALALVSKQMNAFSSHNVLWFQFFKNVAETPEKSPRDEVNYKQLFLDRIPRSNSMKSGIPYNNESNFAVYFKIPDKYDDKVMITKKVITSKPGEDPDVSIFIEYTDRNKYYVLKIHFPYINSSYHLAAEYLTEFDESDREKNWGMATNYSLWPMEFKGPSSYEFLTIFASDLIDGKAIKVEPGQWMWHYSNKILAVKKAIEEKQKDHPHQRCSIM